MNEMLKPSGITTGIERVPLNVAPEAREALRDLLLEDDRFRGVGYSEFILRAVKAAKEAKEGSDTPKLAALVEAVRNDVQLVSMLVSDGLLRTYDMVPKPDEKYIREAAELAEVARLAFYETLR